MSESRFKKRNSDVRSATSRLMALVTAPGDEVVRDATIQRFEFTFEAMWKALKLYLDNEGLQAVSPRDVLRQAFAAGLVPDQGEADQWMAMLDDRSLTSHVYREALAREIYGRIVATHAPRIQRMAAMIETLKWR